jgi:hypothetical protein
MNFHIKNNEILEIYLLNNIKTDQKQDEKYLT